jgi:hypothetical protein
MLTVRHKLTSTDFSDLSNSSRSYLVLVLELFLLGWPTKLADPVEAFYDSCLPKQGRSPPMETTKHHSQGAEDTSGGGQQHQHSSTGNNEGLWDGSDFNARNFSTVTVSF